MTADPPRRRPGGRSARIRTRVHTATLELLSEQTHPPTLPLVAERAGVHPTTLYRRWGTMMALIEDVATEQLTLASPMPDTGSLRSDLEAYARKVAVDLASPVGAALVRAAALSANTDGAEASARFVERMRQISEMLDRARSRGERAPTAQELVEVLLVPMYAHLLFQGRPAGSEYALMLAGRLLRLAECDVTPPEPS